MHILYIGYVTLAKYELLFLKKRKVFMMRRLLLVGIIVLAVPTVALSNPWDTGTLEWSKENTDIGFSAGDLRGCAFNPSTGNVIVASDDSDQLAVLNPSTGSTIRLISNPGTGDTSIDPFRVGVSDDGIVFAHGLEGSFKIIGAETTTNASSSPVINIGGSSASRGFWVQGSHSAKTCVVIIGRGNDIFVYTNAGGSTVNDYTLDKQFVHGWTGEVHGVWAVDDMSSIYLQKQGSGCKKFDLNAGNYTEDTSWTYSVQADWRYDIKGDEGDRMLMGTSAHSGSAPGYSSYITSVLWNNLTGNVIDSTYYDTIGINLSGYYSVGTSSTTNGAGCAAVDEANDALYIAGNNGIAKFQFTQSSVPVEMDYFMVE